MSVAMDRRSFLTRSAATAGGVAFSGTVVDALVADSALATVGKDPGYRYGGKVVVGVGSEAPAVKTFSGSQGHFDGAGYCVALAVYDLLFTTGADGHTLIPGLALSATPDSTYKKWTIKLRPGVLFHNGDPFNADVVVKNYLACVADATNGLAIAPIYAGCTKVDNLTVLYTTKLPWTTFPNSLTGQLAFMAHPDVFDTVSGKAAGPYGSFGTPGGGNPIGTGPFKWKNWVLNGQNIWDRNPHYWGKDAAGRQLPYLDQVEFKVLVDDNSRLQALQAGTVDLMTTGNGGTIRTIQAGISGATWRTDQADPKDPGANMLIVNTAGKNFLGQAGAVDPGTLAWNTSLRSHVSDPNIRKAMAMAINRTAFLNIVDGGTGVAVDGIYQPKSKYYPKGGPGYPAFNPTAGKALVTAYKKAHGISTNLKIVVDLIAQNSGQVKAFSFLQPAFAAIGITLVERWLVTSDLITTKVFKTYDLSAWSQFGGTDPANNFVWLSQGNFVNFAQNSDPIIQKAMLAALAAKPGSSAQISNWALVDQRLAIDLPYLWLDSSVSIWAANSRVKNWAYAVGADGKTQMTNPGGGAITCFQMYVSS